MSNKVAKGAARTVAMLTVLSLVSKVLGFVRETLIASKYGSGSNTDAFFLALSAVGIFTSVLTNAINTTLIPILSEVEAKEGKEGKERHLNNFITIISVVAVVLMVLGYIFAPTLLKFLASGYEDEQFRLVVTLTRLGIPSILFSSLMGVLRGYLQSEGYFKETAVANLLWNALMIVFLVALSGYFDVRGLMVAYMIAQSSPLIIQIYTLKSNEHHYEYVLDIKDQYIGKILKMLPPILVGVAIADINTLVDNSIASNLVTGSVSALNYARKLQSITTGVFVTSIMTVVFPIMAKSVQKEDKTEFKEAIVSGMNNIVLIGIPAAIGLMTLAHPIIKLAFERGKFGPDATVMAASALFFYSIGSIFSGLKIFLYRTFYAIQDTKTPVYASFVTVVISVVIKLLLIGSMQHNGVALGTAIADIVSMFFVLYLLRKKIGNFGFTKNVTVFVKTLIASLGMAVVAHFSFNFLYSIFNTGSIGLAISLFGSVGLAAVVFFVLLLVLKVNEIQMIINVVKRKLSR